VSKLSADNRAERRGAEFSHEVMTEAEAADYLRRSPGMLRQWRTRGQGPAYVREPGSRLIRYLKADLDAHIAAGRVDPSAPAATEDRYAKLRRGA